MPEDGDGAGVGGSSPALAALLVLPLTSGHFKQGGGWFFPLLGFPSISLSGRGRNPGDVPTEMHLLLLLKRIGGFSDGKTLSLEHSAFGYKPTSALCE